MSGREGTREFAFAIALGPVGRFIGGGRRSRDLWYGSRVLSEITRTVAQSLIGMAHVDLVIPTKERVENKSYFPECEGPTISNKILGFMSDATGEEVRAALADARREAQGFLVKQLRWILDSGLGSPLVIRERVEAEIDAIEHGDFIEYYAAFCAVESNGTKREALKRASVLLSARKNTRAFGAPFGQAGAPKSSLDSGRDSVLDEAKTDTAHGQALLLARRRLGIEGQERLDSISVARRISVFIPTDEKEREPTKLPTLPFPPLARVVLVPWLEGAERTRKERLKKVRNELAGLDKDLLCLFSSPCREPGRPEKETLFDFDPSLFLENGIEALRGALNPKRQVGQRFPNQPPGTEARQPEVRVDPTNGPIAEADTFLKKLAPDVAQLLAKLGTPQPYYAMLEADGDGIGAILEEASDSDSDSLVQALYSFADASWNVVAKHEGCAFYAGADELTAYLPVDRALEVADALITLFHSKLCDKNMGGKASLSVGLAIAHLKDDLRATRGEAKQALTNAKKLRRERGSKEGWICIREIPRAGSPRVSAGEAPIAQNGKVGGFADRVKAWEKALAQGLLSMKTAHDLLELAERFDRAEGSEVGLDLARALVKQKPQRSGAKGQAGFDDFEATLKMRSAAWRGSKGWRAVRDFAHEVLLSERLSRVRAQRCAEERGGQTLEEK